MHLSEPSSATAISRLQDRQEAQLAADAAAAKHKLPPFWSNPSDSVSHSTYNPPPGGAAAGSRLTLMPFAAAKYIVDGSFVGSGSVVTPFS